MARERARSTHEVRCGAWPDALWGAVLGFVAALVVILWQRWQEGAAPEPTGAPGEGISTGMPEVPQRPTVGEVEGTEERADEPAAADDLKVIEGIGPKIEALLRATGIRTYAQLAETPVERLRTILAEAGPRFRLADPTTWREQARLAAEGRWEELQALQATLKGGKRG